MLNRLVECEYVNSWILQMLNYAKTFQELLSVCRELGTLIGIQFPEN